MYTASHKLALTLSFMLIEQLIHNIIIAAGHDMSVCAANVQSTDVL